MVDEVHAHVKEMLQVGAICSSQSPWCNAVVLEHKKDGGLCICIDFHKLNVRTKKDSYLLLRIQEAIESLVGAGCCSCLDLKVGFCKLPSMKHWSNAPLSVGNLGIFECKCMSFGLCNAPVTFHRLMQNCLGELNLTYCLIYLDNVIVSSNTRRSTWNILCVVFNHFQEHNLRLRPTKCKYFWDEINNLAWHISKEGMWPTKGI